MLIPDPCLWDISMTAREVAVKLEVHPITIWRWRKKLGIKMSIGAKPGKAVPKRIKREARTCVAEGCNNSFVTVPSVKKRFCSHRCQALTRKSWLTRKAPRKRNLNMSTWKRYLRNVHGASQRIYEANIDRINPNRHPRTLCGVEGGWQLDHIISIKECFARGMTVEEASSIENLRMLPWKDNLMRYYNGSHN
jgi:hypothetical protein